MDNGKISAGQVALLVMSFIIGSWRITPTGLEAWQNLWLFLLLGFVGGLIFAALSLLLFHRFSGKTLFEIHEQVYGPVIGKFFSLLFLWFFLETGGETLSVFITLLQTTVFTSTPDLVLLIPWVIIMVYGCRLGIEAIARSNQLLLVAMVGLVLISVLLVLNIFNPDYLLPFFNLPLAHAIRLTFGIATYPFGQIVIFLMILPRVNGRQKVTGAVLKGMFAAALVQSTLQFLAVGVLGKVGEITFFPTYEFYRMINIGQVLTRMELISLLNFLTMGFIKSMLCLYALSVGTAQLFRLRTYRPLAIPLGVLLVLVARRVYPGLSVHLYYIEKVKPFFSFFFCFVLPFLTLGTAFLRGRPRREMIP